MATEIIIPDFGTSVDYVTLTAWRKQQGDPVKRGDALCELETDKANVEFESFAEGFLLRQMVEPGSEVAIGSVIAYIGKLGEPIPHPDTPAAGDGPSPKPDRTASSPAKARRPDRPGGKIKALPKVRALARTLGVDLAHVEATGPGGVITEQDVRHSAEGPVSKQQQAVARKISQSHREIVPFNITCRIDMSAATAMRERMRADLGRQAAYDGILIHCISRVVKDFQSFLARGQSEAQAPDTDVNIGFAIGIRDAVHMMVVRQADKKKPIEIVREVTHLVFKVARGKVQAGDATGACLTISNLSMHPIHSFNTVIPPGQRAAIAFGAVESTLARRDGEIVDVPMASLTLTVDHRFINGRQAARFLGKVKALLESLDEG